MIIRKTKDGASEAKKSSETLNTKGKWITGKDLIERDIKELPMLWKPYLAKQGIAVLAGSSDCGKSTLLRQLAIAVCRGDGEFLGGELNAKDKRVAIISTEDSEDGVGVVLRKQMQGDKDNDYSDRISFLFDLENLIEDTSAFLGEYPCDMVVVDGWGDLLDGNPNDYTKVRQAIKPWKKLSEIHDCVIIFIHHTVKNSESSAPDKNRLNGSQGLEAKVRCVLELRHGAVLEERNLSVLKCNYLPEVIKRQSLVLKFNNETLTFSNTGNALDRDSMSSRGNKKYADYGWLVEEATKLKVDESLSYDKLRNMILEKYGAGKTPGLTWFKEHIR